MSSNSYQHKMFDLWELTNHTKGSTCYDTAYSDKERRTTRLVLKSVNLETPNVDKFNQETCYLNTSENLFILLLR